MIFILADSLLNNPLYAWNLIIELHNFYPSLNIARVFKTRIMGGAGDAESVGQITNMWNILI